MKELKRYFAYMGKNLTLYWFILIITLIVEASLQILYSYINKQVLNAVEYQNMRIFRTAVIACLIVAILKCLFPYLRYFQIRLVRKMVFKLKLKLFNKLQRLDMDYFEKNHSGDALKTLNWDANALKDSWFSHVYWVLGKIVLGASALLTMFIYSPILTIISLLISGITVIVSIKINNTIKSKAKVVQKSTAKLTSHLSDILSGFNTLKLYSGASIVLDNCTKENDKVTNQEINRVQMAALLQMVSFVLGILGSFGTILAGTLLVSNGKIDYGTVMAVVTLQMSVSDTMQRFGSSLTAFTTSLAKAARVFDFMELECEESLSMNTLEVNRNRCPVSIKNLTFSYPQGIQVFNGLDIDVAANEKIMIMGQSGCGKSTLIKLLMRFYTVNANQIKIYGKDINDYSLEQLRQLVTYVPQNNYLFEGTIAENIAYGCNEDKTITQEDIIHAAKLAYADEFIKQMPQGYETIVNSAGSNLSGGQKQRIAIARAFLKNSPILVMDEPSSALDVESEAKIHASIKELLNNRVVLMVTHRNTGMKEFDRVIYL
jgi:ABC-type multidrug transport system fused ATPase/permease subunit